MISSPTGSEAAVDLLGGRRAHALVVEVPGWSGDPGGRGAGLGPARVAARSVACRMPTCLSSAAHRASGSPKPSTACGSELPGPRARVLVTGPDVSAALDEASRQLSDEDRQRDDARDRHDPLGGETAHGDGDHGDHSDMDMAPAGIPLAGGDQDRDGLEMDVLHVPLGPVLPYWPPGLVLRFAVRSTRPGAAHGTDGLQLGVRAVRDHRDVAAALTVIFTA